MKTVLKTCDGETPGLFRVGIFHRPADSFEGGAVVAWLCRDGCFSMPRNPREARKIAEFTPTVAIKKVENAISVLRFAATKTEVAP